MEFCFTQDQNYTQDYTLDYSQVIEKLCSLSFYYHHTNVTGTGIDGTFLEKMDKCCPKFLKHITSDSSDDWWKIYCDVTGEELPKNEPLKKNNIKDLRGIFYECCYIELYERIKIASESQTSLDNLLDLYPSFTGLDVQELQALMRFHDAMVVAQKCIRPQGHKQKLLEICTHLAEGHTKKYITGRGQTEATNRRVTIFHTVAGDNFRKRKAAAIPVNRKRPASSDITIVDPNFVDNFVDSLVQKNLTQLECSDDLSSMIRKRPVSNETIKLDLSTDDKMVDSSAQGNKVILESANDLAVVNRKRPVSSERTNLDPNFVDSFGNSLGLEPRKYLKPKGPKNPVIPKKIASKPSAAMDLLVSQLELLAPEVPLADDPSSSSDLNPNNSITTDTTAASESHAPSPVVFAPVAGIV